MFDKKNETETIKISLKRLIIILRSLSTVCLIIFFCHIFSLGELISNRYILINNLIGWLIVSTSFVSEILISQHLNSIITNFKKIESTDNKELAKLFLISYKKYLNPFSSRPKEGKTILYALGFSIYSVIPVISFLLGVFFIQAKNTFAIVILVVIGFIIGLLERVDRRHLDKELFLIVPENEKIKRYLSVVFAIVLIGILYIVI